MWNQRLLPGLTIGLSFGLAVLAAAAPSRTPSRAAKDARPQVLIVLAPVSYQEAELQAVLQVLAKRKAHVLIGSTQPGEAKGMAAGTTKIDYTLDQLKAENFDLLVIVGGSGAKMYLWFNPELRRIIQGMNRLRRPVGAISIAPAALAYAGVLKGRRATVLPAPETLKLFRLHEVIYSQEEVVVDGRWITAGVTTAAPAFAAAVGQRLSRRSQAAPLSAVPAPTAPQKLSEPIPGRKSR